FAVRLASGSVHARLPQDRRSVSTPRGRSGADQRDFVFPHRQLSIRRRQRLWLRARRGSLRDGIHDGAASVGDRPGVNTRASLLRWYRRHRRDLPWRQARDPYSIWVAETMLQQTRSKTVLRYYPGFLRRFPNVPALARAPESAVPPAWSG